MQIRRLGEPSPMDDAPDQDSAKIQETKKLKLYFAYPSNPGNNDSTEYQYTLPGQHVVFAVDDDILKHILSCVPPATSRLLAQRFVGERCPKNFVLVSELQRRLYGRPIHKTMK